MTGPRVRQGVPIAAPVTRPGTTLRGVWVAQQVQVVAPQMPGYDERTLEGPCLLPFA